MLGDPEDGVIWTKLEGSETSPAPYPYEVELYRGSLLVGALTFQHGVEPVELNGTTNEQVIEVLLQRLNDFQSGPHRCRENALAITNLEQARFWLWERTRLRRQQGVEGTMEQHA